MTDPTGKSFLSYRRARIDEATRIDEAELLIKAQHDVGIPTWQDINDLRNEPTEQELERVLADPGTANVVIWVTEEVADSDVIKKVEVPAIVRRHQNNDGFFVIPVAAGNTSYDEAAKIVGEYLDMHDFRGWNFMKTAAKQIDVGEAAKIAGAVLRARVAAIAATLADDQPFRLGIYTRARPSGGTDSHLSLDWMGRFSGRDAATATWERLLVPSLRTVATTLDRQDGRRPVEALGRASMPALVALGCAFLEPRGVELTWQQVIPGSRQTQPWSLHTPPEDSGLKINVGSSEAAAQDLAVIVNIRANAHTAVKRGQQDGIVPAFRAIVDVGYPAMPDEAPAAERIGNSEGQLLENGGQATDAVLRTIKALKDAQAKYRGAGTVHLFLAAPAGYAVMLGQKLNALGPIQTYEHHPTDLGGRYEPAVLLHPGS